jgi:hypothetical protein
MQVAETGFLYFRRNFLIPNFSVSKGWVYNFLKYKSTREETRIIAQDEIRIDPSL